MYNDSQRSTPQYTNEIKIYPTKKEQDLPCPE
jgi:hypothetical protein